MREEKDIYYNKSELKFIKTFGVQALKKNISTLFLLTIGQSNQQKSTTNNWECCLPFHPVAHSDKLKILTASK